MTATKTTTTAADMYRAWAKSILSLRQARQDLDAFHQAVVDMEATDATDALRDPSVEDLNEALPAIGWQVKQALQLLDNNTPDAVDYLTGELDPQEGDSEQHAYALTLRREQGRIALGITEGDKNDA